MISCHAAIYTYCGDVESAIYVSKVLTKEQARNVSMMNLLPFSECDTVGVPDKPGLLSDPPLRYEGRSITSISFRYSIPRLKLSFFTSMI